MDLNFEVKEQIIKRLDNNVLVNKSKNYVLCHFDFKTIEWEDENKFAIFKDSWGHSYKCVLGTDSICECYVPNDALKGTSFKVSVYCGDLITSNELTIILIPSGYTTNITSPSGFEDSDVFVTIFDELESKIDKVLYADSSIQCWSGSTLLYEIPLVVDSALDNNSTNPVENRVVSDALDGKADIFDFVEKMDITIQNLIGRV